MDLGIKSLAKQNKTLRTLWVTPERDASLRLAFIIVRKETCIKEKPGENL